MQQSKRTIHPHIKEFIDNYVNTTDRTAISRNFLFDLYIEKYGYEGRTKKTIRYEISYYMQSRGFKKYSGMRTDLRNCSWILVGATPP